MIKKDDSLISANQSPITIIGAGPAGLMTSLYLNAMGIPCRILEKDVFPRTKACGDNISGHTIRAIAAMDPDFIHSFSTTKQLAPIIGAKVYAPNGHALTVDYLPLEKGTHLPSCYAITRSDLDAYLMDQAQAAKSIEIVENCTITDFRNTPTCIQLQTDRGQQLEAPLAIIATGSNHRLAQKLHSKKIADRHFAVGIRAYYEGVDLPNGLQWSELWITKALLPGGLYVTPLPDGRVNVNLVMRKDVVVRKKIKLIHEMETILRTHPTLQKRFKHARRIGKVMGSTLNLGTAKRPISGSRFLLVGDAAGLIDLLSANGLPQAIANAKIAADFARAGVEANRFDAPFFAAYDTKVFNRVEHYLKFGKIMAPMLTSPLFKWGSMAFLNMMARYFDQNEHLRNLMYDNQVGKTLRNPAFYFKVLFGAKHAEGIQ